jgi:hypothetical protein
MTTSSIEKYYTLGDELGWYARGQCMQREGGEGDKGSILMCLKLIKLFI